MVGFPTESVLRKKKKQVNFCFLLGSLGQEKGFEGEGNETPADKVSLAALVAFD